MMKRQIINDRTKTKKAIKPTDLILKRKNLSYGEEVELCVAKWLLEQKLIGLTDQNSKRKKAISKKKQHLKLIKCGE